MNTHVSLKLTSGAPNHSYTVALWQRTHMLYNMHACIRYPAHIYRRCPSTYTLGICPDIEVNYINRNVRDGHVVHTTTLLNMFALCMYA
jgi:hypothetical protein